jgi:hypothetical protein
MSQGFIWGQFMKKVEAKNAVLCFNITLEGKAIEPVI